MFTGLIREIAQVERFEQSRLRLRARYRPSLGDSVAVNGVCLSVVACDEEGFEVELSPETQGHIALERYQGGVHIEPAMAMGDRFEGHIVQGHVDAIAQVSAIHDRGNSVDMIIRIDPSFLPLIPPKGSITVDGVSLTVNEVLSDGFRLTLIPITMRESLFHTYRIGTRVNIETDLFARYVRHLMGERTPSAHDQVASIAAWY